MEFVGVHEKKGIKITDSGKAVRKKEKNNGT